MPERADAMKADQGLRDPKSTGRPSPQSRERSAHGLLAIQQSAGNRAVLSMLGAQAKIEVGAAGDRYEVEADKVANEVVARLRASSALAPAGVPEGGGESDARRSSPIASRLARLLQRQPDADSTATIGAEGGTLSKDTEAQLHGLRRGGSPLPADTRRAMGGAFGADFDGVRIHRGDQAAALNRSMGAAAFTVGPDIFLGGSTPSLESREGQQLLAHELTHTIQQGAARPDARAAQRALARIQRDGGNQQTTKTAPQTQSAPTSSKKASPEVKKAIEAFANAEPSKIEAAANAYAKKKSEAKDIDLGKGVKGSGSAQVASQAGAWGGAEIVELENSYALLVEAGVVVGAAISLEGDLEREFGPVKAKLAGKFQAFAGAMAKASGRLEVGAEGLAMSGEAMAFAGAKSKQGVSLEFTAGDVGAELGFEAEEMAGALASAKGGVSFTKNEIAIGGEVEAFAGARVEGTATAKGKLYGRDAFNASGKLKAEAGVGGKAKGGFSFRRGVLHIEFDADAAAGIGFGGGADIYTDFKPIAVYIWRQMDKFAWSASPGESAKVLNAPQTVKPELVRKLKEYSDFKVTQVKADKADNYVKQEKVEAIIGSVLPRKQVKGDKNAAQVDAVIKEAIEESLLPAKGKTKVAVKVKDGKVQEIKDLADPKELKGGVKSKTGEALSSIIPYEDK